MRSSRAVAEGSSQIEVSKKSRILIGILFSGEPDYEHCKDALSKQTYTNFSHFCIEWKSKLEAHEELFATFMKSADDAGYFLKLDADMVLSSHTYLERLVGEFEKHPEVVRITTPVYDYFTDGMIYGMHAWRSSHQWQKRESSVFTDDDVSLPAGTSMTLSGWHGEKPEVLHCAHSSDFYGFHFGLHRGLKARALLANPLARRGNLINNVSMWKSMNIAAKKHGDSLRVYACLGYKFGIAGKADAGNISYTSPHARSLFEDLQNRLNRRPALTKALADADAIMPLAMAKVWASVITGVHSVKSRISKPEVDSDQHKGLV